MWWASPTATWSKFRRYIKEPYGMVLVTGPTGSGKTTTLYAALSEIKNDEDKIITIEDPVEYQIKGITQIPVNEKKGLTFARGLRSILRHDPDKIMVGEIRDQETAQIAINSALTGHLVFTTVHANNVLDVLGRFLNMGVEPYNFVSALNCILAQRLVRVICEHCKTPVTYPDSHAGRKRPRIPTNGATCRSMKARAASNAAARASAAARAIHELLDLTRPHSRNDSGPAARLRKSSAPPGRRHDVPARFGGGKDAAGHHHLAGNQQGHVHRGVMRIDDAGQAQIYCCRNRRPRMAFEISEAGIAAARIGARAELDFLPLEARHARRFAAEGERPRSGRVRASRCAASPARRRRANAGMSR